MPGPKTLYRLLLKLYPARFREEYEKPLQGQFQDEYNELQGFWSKTAFWLHAVADLAFSIPEQIFYEFRQDFAYALRVYRQRYVTVALALVALALTIGVTTGVFSVVNTLLFRSLPFHNPDRLVELRDMRGTLDNPENFHSWAATRPYLTDAATYRTETMTLDAAGQARRVRVAETSANFLQLLGSDAFIGRPFAAGEDTPGRSDIAMVGYGLWQQLGADPHILGSIIRVNGVPLTVVGVAPGGLDYPSKSALWTPTIFQPGHLSKSRAIVWTVDGRLAPAISIGQASQQYRAESLARAKAAGIALSPDDLARLRIIPLREQLSGNVQQISLVLFGIVVFVLLTACANVAHLLLSRITERQKELGLRAALGASRSRLLQQFITETTVLTTTAAIAGLLIAHWVARLASVIQPPSLTGQYYSILNWPVLLFAIALAILTGLVFGVLPAGFLSRLHTSSIRKGRVQRLRTVLVALQAAFTVVLLAGALTMSRSFLKIAGADLGLRTDHVVTLSVALSGTPREKNAPAYYTEALDRLRATPGVEAAGAIEFLPLERSNFIEFPFQLDNGSAAQVGAPFTATAGYLRATGTPIIEGRDFSDDDNAAAKPVAIVNQTFARQFGPSFHPLGQRLNAPFGAPLTIIGVARTQRYSPTDSDLPIVYRLADWSPVLNMTLVARVHGDAQLYQPICRDAVRSVDPRVPIYGVSTLDERLRGILSRPRFYTAAVLLLSGFALLLAIIGIYGVASFAVQQRSHEIGVRLAIGAQPRRLRVSLLRESLIPVTAGLALGIAAAVVFGRVLEHLMDGVDPVGFSICAAAAVVLVFAAATAVWTATRRIVRMDPMKALRAD